MSSIPPPQPPAGSAPSEQQMTNLILNYWLSVFFSWIPALIFYLVDKGKHPLVDDHNRETLNFNILRGIVIVAGVIPYVGLLAGVFGIVLFVFAIIAAVKGPEAAKQGLPYKYILNIPFIK